MEKPAIIEMIANRCPLYGHDHVMGLLVYTKGNQCPLKDGFSPCYFCADPNAKTIDPNNCPIIKMAGGIDKVMRTFEGAQVAFNPNARTFEELRARCSNTELILAVDR